MGGSSAHEMRAGKTSVCLVAGARPNFMKVAPVYRALMEQGCFAPFLVHTGQHYDQELSEVFFCDLELPVPACSLDVGPGSHARQTARILERFEAVLGEREPEWVVVFGDVNSTVACALAAAKFVYPSGQRPRIAHVEAGLRSFDRTMPEETNRIVTDAISDLLFTTEESANANLAREGIAAEKIFFVGNVMIDTLLGQMQRVAGHQTWKRLGLPERGYGVLTLHRPANVDEPDALRALIDVLSVVATRLPLVFPVHPRTLARLREFRLEGRVGAEGGWRLVPPMGYRDFLSLVTGARLVLTDSGGIQEETTILGIPCLTLRRNTERPVTITAGTNRLVGSDPHRILSTVEDILTSRGQQAQIPRFWDGHAARRIAEVLEGVG